MATTDFFSVSVRVVVVFIVVVVVVVVVGLCLVSYIPETCSVYYLSNENGDDNNNSTELKKKSVHKYTCKTLYDDSATH